MEKAERRIDDEGDSYYSKKMYISPAEMNEADDILNEAAKVYRDTGYSNTNPFYKEMSRLAAHIRMDFIPKSLDELMAELVVHEQT